MKTNQSKMFNIFVLSLCTLFLFSCKEKGANLIEYNPVDLSGHKLTPKLAKKLSKRYVKDMDDLFAESDSLAYYKALVEQLRNPKGKKGAGNTAQNEPIIFKPKKPKFELSVSSRYTVDELLTYINSSIKTVEKSGGTVDGFRIYIGVFPKKGDGKKNNTLTTFIVPTGTMGGSKNKEEGNILPNFAVPLYKAQDITSVDGLEYGSTGQPPSMSYPQ